MIAFNVVVVSAKQTRLVFCGVEDGEELSERYCEAVLKPKNTRTCTNKRCKGKWMVGKWSEVGAHNHRGLTRSISLTPITSYSVRRPAVRGASIAPSSAPGGTAAAAAAAAAGAASGLRRRLRSQPASTRATRRRGRTRRGPAIWPTALPLRKVLPAEICAAS